MAFNDAGSVASRLDRIRTLLEANGSRAAVLSSPENVRYFSGFFSSTYSRPLLLTISVSGEAILLVPSLEQALARRYAGVPWRTYDVVPPEAELESVFQSLDLKGQSVAVEMDDLSATLYLRIMSLQSDLVQDLGDAPLRVRSIKDTSEIEACRRAGLIGRLAAEAGIASTQEGARELEIKAAGEQVGYREAAKRYPNDNFWIWANVVSGSRTDAAGGHDLSCGRPVRSGEVVFHVWHTSCNGYWSSVVRTVLVGRVASELRNALVCITQTQRLIRERLFPGVSAAEVAEGARAILDEHGLSRYFRGTVGRGIGLSWAELPSISIGSQETIEAGMVLRVECSVIGKPGGVLGVEDTIVVTENGNELFT